MLLRTLARRLRCLLLVGVLAVCSLGADAATSIGLLSDSTPSAKLGPEGKAARELAMTKYSAKLIRVIADGKFVDSEGKTASLSSFDVLWRHQGDSAAQTGPIYGKKTAQALRAYVSNGKGLFLSGAALVMVKTLGVETASPRCGRAGKDNGQAGLVPLHSKHPIFSAFQPGGRRIMLTNAGHPAYADFHGSGGPVKGMLLARSSGGGENPLVEYKLGSGRIIAMGWRLPHYSNANNPHRGNLEKLTVNILGYLGDAKKHQKIVLTPVSPRSVRQASPAKQPQPKMAIGPLRLAIKDLKASNGAKYPKGAEYLKRLDAIEKQITVGKETPELLEQFQKLRAEALLANPLLNFDKLLVVRRKKPGLVANWQSNSSMRGTGYDNEIAVLSPVSPEGELKTLFKPEGGRFVGDVDLEFAADKMLFSMGSGSNGRWQVCEIDANGKNLRELPLIKEKDVNNYDACYLPDKNVIFSSTAPFIGVPCVKGSSHVTNLYLLESASGKIRRLTFDQDHNWCPTVLNNGRVLYLRWEYCDIPHYVSRILFHMNPDGTDQKEYYGSNSYWPNSTFFARPIPGDTTKFVGVISGHHDTHRMGELILFDTAKGRFEADGVIQRIPGHGKKVEPIILDGLVKRSWPKFLHPYPLSDKYFIVAAQPRSRSRWGIYLVDVFDNMLLLKETPGGLLFEPIPFRKTPRPQLIASRIDTTRKDGVMYMTDVYGGRGLEGVPKGAVKKLRIFSYQFAYHGMGGQINRVGLDGPWDVKRIMGTVPVEADGSALFTVPANTPISVQPLDADGRAIALMRSWATVMPGETQACIGCHESQNDAPGTTPTAASRRKPSEIAPWYGVPRGFSFKREVQPVLDKYCVGCHDGKPRKDKKTIPDFTARDPVHPKAASGAYNKGTKFTPSYMALRSYVRAATIESDMHMLEPYEFHASSTALVQMLDKGHNNVKLDAEAWDRIITWIDLNTPAHGSWLEVVGERPVSNQRARRLAMLKLYASIDDDLEYIGPETKKPTPIIPAKLPKAKPQEITAKGWPFTPEQAAKMQNARAKNNMSVDLGDRIKLDLVWIPAGEFVMGSLTGDRDEWPRAKVAIEKGFWIGSLEVTNAQYAQFDPKHNSRLEHGDFLQFSTRERGYPVNGRTQPVCRVSWNNAVKFCQWLSKKAGNTVTLPTEAQWEYACRAGSAGSMSYGPVDTDFAKLANLADSSLRKMDKLGWGLPVGAVPPWKPAIESVNDGHRVSAAAGGFKPNAWAVHDMHGNVAEWTRSAYKPYPYKDDDGRNTLTGSAKRTVRGGSWFDRPKHATSSFRLKYEAHQKVYNVGFRVVVESE
ncbi:MAG: SUMF1/EgtB/PvdO family nonheme iron enzyme [Phycisphaerae bacterium]|jgi:formylglycine-generating enzyme required for sulfatase activity|nr:SUMF1/EgtB/PvdO family nonheme iron enzyme [Phycisphaerae bacterium]